MPAKRFRVGAKLLSDSLYIAKDQRTLLSSQRPNAAPHQAAAPVVEPPSFCTHALLPTVLDWDPNDGLILECKNVQNLHAYHVLFEILF